MKKLFRIFLTTITILASYFFIFWVPFSIIPKAHNIPAIPITISLLIAVMIGRLVWRQTGNISDGLLKFILMGGLLIGSIGFIIGFFGPMLFTPDSNQGPLLGIFFTGPLGFLVGLIVGGIYWVLQVKNKKS